MTRFTDCELRQMLRHPDAFLRSHADRALEYRGAGTRGLAPDPVAADNMEWKLIVRSNALREAGLFSSNGWTLTSE